ncbi:MAG: hypothetical protein ABEI58_00340 [Candidatus Nanohaloarchaea archaeon]
MKFSELPGSIRVKLDAEGERELWHRIDEFGSVKQFAEAFDYPETRLYNWRNQDLFYPVDFVRQVMGLNATDQVVAMKGGVRSLPTREPEFPLPEDDELLTRVEESVNVNEEGVPVYRTGSPGTLERFRDLLRRLGNVPASVYRNRGYELRYPKYIHSLLVKMEYETDFAALVDESGVIENGYLKARGEKVPVEEFSGELFSREKRLALAMERGDPEEISRIMAERSEAVREAFGL